VVQSRRFTIVLVHCAFADGSNWSRVIPLLETDGYTKSSHVPFLSHPKEVVKVIEAAASASSVGSTQ
jgi:hypothetical protein